MTSALLHLTPVLAAEKSKVPFYIAGGALALWAIVISVVIGLRRPDFPATAAAQRTVMAVSAVLVALAAGTAVATSGGGHTATAAAPSPGLPATTGGTPAPAGTGSTGPVAGAGTLAESADPSGALAFTKPKLHAPAGPVTIVFSNMAPVAHNLTIASSTGTVLAATPTFSGGAHTLSLRLKRGTYTFYCSVPGHRQAGMQGTITVG